FKETPSEDVSLPQPSDRPGQTLLGSPHPVEPGRIGLAALHSSSRDLGRSTSRPRAIERLDLDTQLASHFVYLRFHHSRPYHDDQGAAGSSCRSRARSVVDWHVLRPLSCAPPQSATRVGALDKTLPTT